jgi:alginate O-acetyltransferase complex protein AlgI
MTFTTPSFYLFLAAVYLAFRCCSARWRPELLLAASYLFYFLQGVVYQPLILVAVTIIAHAAGLSIGVTSDERKRLFIMWVCIVLCVGTLIAAKLNALTSGFVALGVSFYTLQAISYIVDVYLQRAAVMTRISDTALYLAFFPKLLQGPIERASVLWPQLRSEHPFEHANARAALLLFARGLFRKVVVADRLAVYVNNIYDDVYAYRGIVLVFATWTFALQVYFDFAGYTDMARAAARLFGIELSENFKHPYLARNVGDFWRRWHISFSAWLLDYIFKPVQFLWRRGGVLGTSAALLLTFALSGLWHGFTICFLSWGVIHGLFLAASTWYRPKRRALLTSFGLADSRWLPVWQVFVTFNLVSFAWVFFRARSFGDALFIIRSMFVPTTQGIGSFLHANGAMGGRDLGLMVVCLAALSACAIWPRIAQAINRAFAGRARWLWYYATAMLILIFGWFGRPLFIYGRF